MSLSNPTTRREIHHRVIDMRAYVRGDGLFDVEARLVDRKPFPFLRIANPEPAHPGQPLHDLSIRLTVDGQYVVRAVEASSDVTPFDICKEAERTLSGLIGERISSGWSSKVKSLLRGTASCTHLMEMLIPMATTAFQGIRGLAKEGITSLDPAKMQVNLDSCYAYARHRNVVRIYWPQHYQAVKPSDSSA
jgi:hypothetical protein